MDNEKKLRQFLQDRFDHEAFDFDGTDWEHTRKYISSRRKKENAGAKKRALLLLLLLGVGSAASFLLVIPEKAEQNKNTRALAQVQHPKTVVNHQTAPAASSLIAGHRPIEAAQQTSNTAFKKNNPVPATWPQGSRTDKETVSTKENDVAEQPPGSVPPAPEVQPGVAIEPVAGPEILNGVQMGSMPFLQTTPDVLSLGINEIKSSAEHKALFEETKTGATESQTPALTAVIDEGPDPEQRPEPGKHHTLPHDGLSLELGAAWLAGWSYPSGHDGRGFTPAAGLSWMSRSAARSALSFGIQYMMVPQLSSAQKTSRVTSFKFGEKNQVTTITPVRLHYLLVPLRFHWYDNRNNVFGGGANLGYLLNVDAEISRHNESPGSTGDYETMHLSGYDEGMNWYDVQLNIFYRREISRSFGLQAELFWGLADIKNDAFFKQNFHERNSGIRLALIYTPSYYKEK